MTEHPLYRMWKERLDAEIARESAWAARLVQRKSEREGWYEAWCSYKARLDEVREPEKLPRWWNLTGWVMWLMRLHSPGRPN